MTTLDNPGCFGTKEFSEKSYICKTCRVRPKCRKTLKNRWKDSAEQ